MNTVIPVYDVTHGGRANFIQPRKFTLHEKYVKTVKYHECVVILNCIPRANRISLFEILIKFAINVIYF